MNNLSIDVVIVGGGLSGLSAARKLSKQGLDDFLVLEAGDRVGGRCRLGEAGDVSVDIGGMFVAPGQDELITLGDELGIARYKLNHSGKMVRWFDTHPTYVDSDEPELDASRSQVVSQSLEQLAALGDQVSAHDPWNAPNAAELDATTLEEWIQQQSDDPAVIKVLARNLKNASAAPNQISLLAYASFVASCGGWDMLENEVDQLFVGGAGQLPRLMAEELGSRVLLNSPIDRIHWSDEGAEIISSDIRIHAKKVIIAMNPADAGRIHYHPGLPTARQLIHRNSFSAALTKSMVVYEYPFWRDATDEVPRLTGYAQNDHGCPHAVFDVSPQDNSVGILAAMTRLQGEGDRFVPGQDVLDSPTMHREKLLESLGEMFGSAALEPLSITDVNWFEVDFINGCLGWLPPGGLSRCGHALKEAVGPIHWAGSESADAWRNHLNGAVQSGQRAALEVLSQLS